MEKKQMSVHNVLESQSSSSRRVMWKVGEEEEEVFDSVVNYRLLLPDNLEHEQASQSKASTDDKKAINETSDVASKRRARVLGYWHRLFDRLRIQASPSLALRYKPSDGSLKDQHSSKEASKDRAGDIKLETCFFPPYQTAVVREVAPTFAHRLCMPDDSDSCCSGSIELRIPLLKTSRIGRMSKARVVHESTSTYSQPETAAATTTDNAKFKRRNKKTVGSSIAGAGGNSSRVNNSNKSASNGSANCVLPTLRQRQLELHRYRVLIEKRRLELLDLKIVRERADSLRHEILFHKDLQLKHNQIKAYEDNNSSQA
ncbi:uncharacterized protein LOC117574049 [Drosophila albomicans]|uniref:Uncharacterized protein LOC117574049 n=1 Tax=Drosophila albomicans TaxID=7291 RepID=A0A6P8XBE6_DROAB|nr:uncharacterized protein LOC117574049 [Drosophila albomicans]